MPLLLFLVVVTTVFTLSVQWALFKSSSTYWRRYSARQRAVVVVLAVLTLAVIAWAVISDPLGHLHVPPR